MSYLCLTHSGSFHADDVMAAVLLKQAGMLDDYSHVLRSRKEEDFARADILFDVGGEYNHLKKRYDHHQRGQSGMFWEDGTPFSSAGLIWHHYATQISTDKFVCQQISDMWIRPIDADDNGTIKNIPSNSRHISTIIGELNPCWNDDTADEDAAYVQACQMVEIFLLASIKRAKGALAAYDHVLAAVKKHAGNEVLILDTFCPWKSHFHEIEARYAPGEKFKFVVYPADREESGWKIFQIPLAKGCFEGRAYLPEPWGGLREEELRKVSGINDARFVHPNLFCGGAATLKGALEMVSCALDRSK